MKINAQVYFNAAKVRLINKKNMHHIKTDIINVLINLSDAYIITPENNSTDPLQLHLYIIFYQRRADIIDQV